MNDRAINGACAAINAHNQSMHLEEGNGHETDLWHLVYSLIEWCDAYNVDFDATVSAVRQDMKETSPI